MGQLMRLASQPSVAYPFYLDGREHALEHRGHELELRFRRLARLLLKVVQDELGRTSIPVITGFARLTYQRRRPVFSSRCLAQITQ